MIAQPSYLLFSDIGNSRSGASFIGEEPQSGKWKFVLEHLGGPVGELPERFEASDVERGATPDRLALMAVVRGLEALEQPSRVKLVTTHRYVERGLRYGLPSWREKDYHWERFGSQIPVRNADLWKRVDIALQFHAVDCRYLQTATQSEAAVSADVAEAMVTTVEGSSHATASETHLDADDGFIDADSFGRTTFESTAASRPLGELEAHADRPVAREMVAFESTQVAAQSSLRAIRYDLFAKRRMPSTHSSERTQAQSARPVAKIFAEAPHVSVQWIPQSLQSWWHLIGGWIRWMKGRLQSPFRPFAVSHSTPSRSTSSALVGV